jgi:SMC interacting uncharacterized protein involved in chromosome segregation
MMLCVGCLTLHSQTKDLNSPERVEALYKITIQHRELTKQVKDCQNRYNEEMQSFENKFNQIQSLAVALGEESSAFVSHNLDLQEGLLGSLKKQEEQEVKIAKLESKNRKRFGIGFYGGYDVINNQASAGVSFHYTLIRLF